MGTPMALAGITTEHRIRRLRWGLFPGGIRPSGTKLVSSMLKANLYKPLGFLFLALGIAGIALPVLPSTPFILLAAWFFARSSERWHRRLLQSELFGPMILNWERERCISCRTKIVALCSMALAGSASIFWALQDPRLQLATGLLMTLGCATILLLKTCPAADKDSPL